jgi:hypothetical protein
MSEKQTIEAGNSLPQPLVRLFNAIKDAVTEMDRCPGDSIQDIWNEMLDKWETGLRMDHNHNIDPNNDRHLRPEQNHHE